MTTNAGTDDCDLVKRIRWKVAPLDSVLRGTTITRTIRMGEDVGRSGGDDGSRRLDLTLSGSSGTGGEIDGNDLVIRLDLRCPAGPPTRVALSLAVSCGGSRSTSPRGDGGGGGRRHAIIDGEILTIGRDVPTFSFRPLELGEVGELIRKDNCIIIEMDIRLISQEEENGSEGGAYDSASFGAMADEAAETLAETVTTELGCHRDNYEHLSDVSLVSIDGAEHSAHRLLLSIRSPVLYAAFHHDMEESRKGKVNVDATYGATEQLLKFLYTDHIDDLTGEGDDDSIDDSDDEQEADQLLMEVFSLGSFYDLPRLRVLAQTQMTRSLSVRTAPGRLLLALRHGCAPDLAKDCVDLIRNNLRDVMGTNGWDLIAGDGEAMTALMSSSDCDDGDGEGEEWRRWAAEKGEQQELWPSKLSKFGWVRICFVLAFCYLEICLINISDSYSCVMLLVVGLAWLMLS